MRLDGLRSAPPVALAIAASLAGGVAFDAIGLPMPWLLGPICATAGLAIVGMRMRVPGTWRNTVLAVLGLMIGSTLQPQALHHLARWPLSLFGVVLYVFTVSALFYGVLRRFGGYDPVTAFFSATPGGFMAMTVIGGDMGGNERAIALNHAVRITLVVFIIVFGYRLLVGHTAGGQQAGAYVALNDLGWMTALIFVGCGVAGAWLGTRLHLPGGGLLGPLALAALVHLTGWSEAQLPTVLIYVAELVLGASLGCQFLGVTLGEIGREAGMAGSMTLCMLLVSALFAYPLSLITGVPLTAMFLAFAPGGLSGISLIALALGINPAFVTVHNVVRVCVILVAAPLLFRVAAPRTRA